MTKTKQEDQVTKDSSPKTEAEKIWQEIKDKPIEMFSLPSQVVHQYCTPFTIEPTKLYVQASATSVLPALESALGHKFSVERMERFLVISRVK
jgi:hypothetical protein